MIPITEGDTPPDFDVQAIDLDLALEVRGLPALERPMHVPVRGSRLLTSPPWVRSLGKLTLEVTTQGWRFPTPPGLLPPEEEAPSEQRSPAPKRLALFQEEQANPEPPRTRLMPTRDTVLFKDRLLY